MSLEVLQAETEVAKARNELRRRKISCVSPWWLRMLRDRGLLSGVNVGDYIKSWDVLRTTKFIEENVSKNAPILDIGAYASEIICVLHRLGYSKLFGVDLNSHLSRMPHGDEIRYEVANFMQTPFDDESFEAITSISVIEHGFQGEPLLKEVSRLLKPGGYFVASFDYWPEKLDTDGVKMFDMDWCIFSKDDVTNLVREASRHGLVPVGALNHGSREPFVQCAGKSYTFAWLALRKEG